MKSLKEPNDEASQTIEKLLSRLDRKSFIEKEVVQPKTFKVERSPKPSTRINGNEAFTSRDIEKHSRKESEIKT